MRIRLPAVRSSVGAAITVGLSLSTAVFSQARDASTIPAPTTAIVLGVGSPAISAERSGTSIGVATGGTLYLFDAGAGVERRLMEAAPQLMSHQIKRLGPVFISHLHMDHTLGLAALYFYHRIDPRTGLLVAAGGRLEVYGPKPVKGLPGIDSIMESLRAA